MRWSLERAFQGVGDWCERTGRRGGFPTGEYGASASPYVDVYRVIELNSSVVEQRNVHVVDLGVDPDRPDPNWALWRQIFTAANAYAHSQGFFHAFPDFRRISSSGGIRLRVNLIREFPDSGVSWQDVPAAEIFPMPPLLPPEMFVYQAGADWILLINQWARSHGFMAGIPTGWVANYGGTWVVGIVLFRSQAGVAHFVHGNELFVEEDCGLVTSPPISTTPSPSGSGSVLVGTASIQPVFTDESPFDDRLYAAPSLVDYLRCLAGRTGQARVALINKNRSEGVSMTMTPRKDGRTLVFFGNRGTAGAWIEAHRLNAAMTSSLGLARSFWLGPGSAAQFAFELTPGVAAPGQVVAHSVGFVKQGILGVAAPVMSFAWSTFLRISPGMNLTFVWT